MRESKSRVQFVGGTAVLAVLLSLASGCSVEDVPGASDMRAHELSLAVSEDGRFAAWHGGTGQGSAIYIQQLDGSDLVGTPFAVTDMTVLAYEPDLIMAGDRLCVAWYEKDESTGELWASLAAYAPGGELLWQVPLGNVRGSGTYARNPVIRQLGQTLRASWIAQPASDDGSNRASIQHQAFTLEGVPIGEPRTVGEANRDTWNLNAAAFGDAIILSYDAALGSTAHELQLVVLRDGGVDRARLGADDGHASLYPDLQVNEAGQAALTWFDERDGNSEIYLAVGPLAEFAAGRLPEPHRITRTPGESIGAYIAWQGETLGLAWSDEIERQRNIYVATFDEAGQPLGQTQQFSDTRESSSVPAIRAAGSGFLLAWNDYVVTGEGAHGQTISSVARFGRLPAAD